MTNLELISTLLHMPMGAEVIFRANGVEFNVERVVQLGMFPPPTGNQFVLLTTADE